MTPTSNSRGHAYKGWTITRGAYRHGTSDRADRWYVDDGTTTTVDRRGPGYATLAEARSAIDEHLDLLAYYGSE